MRAGAYKYDVEIQRQQVTTSAYGSDRIDWVKLCSTRAAIEYLSGGREQQNHEIFYAWQLKFILHAYVPVQDEDRIAFDGKFYRILSIQPQKETTRNQITVITELINE